MTTEEEAGWRQVEVIITSSPSQDSSNTQQKTEESSFDHQPEVAPASPLPAAPAPVLPAVHEEPPRETTVQDKDMSNKHAQRGRMSSRFVCLSQHKQPLSLALPGVHTAALQPQTGARRYVDRRTHTETKPKRTHRLPAVLCFVVLCCAGR